MALNDWQDGAGGGTPLTAARLNERDAAIVSLQSAISDLVDDVAALEGRVAALETPEA